MDECGALLVFTDALLQLKDSFQFQNFAPEAKARWQLVETGWNLRLNPTLLEVQYDEAQYLFFLKRNLLRRINITSACEALNGYQKGKCF